MSGGPAVRRSGPRFDPRLVVVIAGYALKACFPTKRRIGLALPAAGALLFAVLAHVIPERAPVGTVRQAKEALKPAEVQSAQARRHLKGKAQGRNTNDERD